MPTSRPITIEQLADARRAKAARFERFFGSRVDLTVALAEQHAADFSFHWLAEHLLSDAEWDIYCEAYDAAKEQDRQVFRPAEAEFERVWAGAGAKFDKFCRRAWGRLRREERDDLRARNEEPPGIVEARAELRQVCDEARARCDAECNPAREEFRRKIARAFAESYLRDGGQR